jgi:hypothetical protein
VTQPRGERREGGLEEEGGTRAKVPVLRHRDVGMLVSGRPRRVEPTDDGDRDEADAAQTHVLENRAADEEGPGREPTLDVPAADRGPPSKPQFLLRGRVRCGGPSQTAPSTQLRSLMR